MAYMNRVLCKYIATQSKEFWRVRTWNSLHAMIAHAMVTPYSDARSDWHALHLLRGNHNQSAMKTIRYYNVNLIRPYIARLGKESRWNIQQRVTNPKDSIQLFSYKFRASEAHEQIWCFLSVRGCWALKSRRLLQKCVSCQICHATR